MRVSAHLSRYVNKCRLASLSCTSSFLTRYTQENCADTVSTQYRTVCTNNNNIFNIARGGDQKLLSRDITTNVDGFKKVYVAVGANMGDRFANLLTALRMLNSTTTDDIEETSGLSSSPIRVIRTSFLRETEPMYVTDQPSFLNGAIEIDTQLSPHCLLKRLKDIEKKIGRDLNNGQRYGPRPIDLDIIYYGVRDQEKVSFGGDIVDTENLEVPHPRMQERDFVLSPLCDLNRNVIHPTINESAEKMLLHLSCDSNKSKEEEEGPPAYMVLPLPRGRMLSFNKVHIMGILNVTPDSFSDGGKYKASVDLAVKEALQLVEDGATIIDIGGESTRPGAKEVEVDIEMQRTIPVIQKLREVSDVAISIDTRHALVAKTAIEAGADIVNDVSGGTFDPDMFSTVADLNVPCIIMHSRGTPETMQSLTQYEDVVAEVSDELMRQSIQAEKAGIPLWLQILDPGIGFAKDLEQNLLLMKHSNTMRRLVNDIPLLLGPSRKGFIGKITGEEVASERDFGTLAACISSLFDHNGKLAPTILRVHNVKGIKQGIDIIEAISKAK